MTGGVKQDAGGDLMSSDAMTDVEIMDRISALYREAGELSVILNRRRLAVMTDEEKHAEQCHPDFEYAMSRGPRKAWDPHEPEGDGWVSNVRVGRNGWERFDYHEEAYWMRRKAAG